MAVADFLHDRYHCDCTTSVWLVLCAKCYLQDSVSSWRYKILFERICLASQRCIQKVSWKNTCV